MVVRCGSRVRTSAAAISGVPKFAAGDRRGGSPRSVHWLLMAVTPDVSAETWVARVRDLAPVIERYRDEAERQRRLPRPLFEALRDAGFFGLWVPRTLGGAEVDIETSVRSVEELSRLDGAVGWNVMIAGNTSILWANLEQPVAAEMVQGGRKLVIAGTVTSGSGTAHVVPGGFRLSGRWPFASGCHQADWLVCVGQILEDGEPRRGPDGMPRTYTFAVPAADCEILDTWHTVGLRGTGSHDFEARDLFGPEGRHFPSRGGASYQTGPLYNTHFYHLWGPNIAAVALGIARTAIDLFLGVAASKRYARTSVTVAERETVQDRVGQAEGLLRSSRAFLYETIRETWQLIARGAEVPEQVTAVNRLAAATAVDYAVQAVDLIFTLGGTTSVYAH